MLRLLVFVLVLANALFFVWSHGYLSAYGFAATTTNEPQRLQQQIRPQELQLLPASDSERSQAAAAQASSAANPASSPASNPTPAPVPTASAASAAQECWQAGPFAANQTDALRQLLPTALAQGSWSLEPLHTGARWIIYMGKFPNQQALAKKRSEIEALHLPIEALLNPQMEPGFSLGNFESKAAAEAALTALGKRGIRSAHVAQEQEETVAYYVKVPAVSDALKPKLLALQAQLGVVTFARCSVERSYLSDAVAWSSGAMKHS